MSTPPVSAPSATTTSVASSVTNSGASVYQAEKYESGLSAGPVLASTVYVSSTNSLIV
jgi:hypothetical protein